MRLYYLIASCGFFVLSFWAFITSKRDEGFQLMQLAFLTAIMAELNK